MDNVELDQQVEETIDAMYERMYAKIENDKEAKETFRKLPLSFASVASMSKVFNDVMEKKPNWNRILYSLMRLRCTVLDGEGQFFCTAWFDAEKESSMINTRGDEREDKQGQPGLYK